MAHYLNILDKSRDKNMKVSLFNCLISYTLDNSVFIIINALRWRTHNQSYKIIYTQVCVQWPAWNISNDSTIRHINPLMFGVIDGRVYVL